MTLDLLLALTFRYPRLNSPAPNAGTLAIEGMTHVPMTVLDGHLQRRFASRYVQLGRSLAIDQWGQVRRLTSPYIRRGKLQSLIPFCVPQNTLTVHIEAGLQFFASYFQLQPRSNSAVRNMLQSSGRALMALILFTSCVIGQQGKLNTNDNHLSLI